MSSAVPDAERTSTPSSKGTSATGSRLRRWRKGSPAAVDVLDEEQAEALVRDSAERLRDADPVSAATAEVEDHEPGVVISVPRWHDETSDETSDEAADETVAGDDEQPASDEQDREQDREQGHEQDALRDAADDEATRRVIAQAIATGMVDHDEAPTVRRGLLRRKTGYYSPAPARPVVDPAPPVPVDADTAADTETETDEAAGATPDRPSAPKRRKERGSRRDDREWQIHRITAVAHKVRSHNDMSRNDALAR